MRLVRVELYADGMHGIMPSLRVDGATPGYARLEVRQNTGMTDVVLVLTDMTTPRR